VGKVSETEKRQHVFAANSKKAQPGRTSGREYVYVLLVIGIVAGFMLLALMLN
jgi:hypothetical protein